MAFPKFTVIGEELLHERLSYSLFSKRTFVSVHLMGVLTYNTGKDGFFLNYPLIFIEEVAANKD